MPDKKIYCHYFSQMWQNICKRISASKFPSGVYTRSFHKRNAPLRVAPTRQFLNNFYFCDKLHHSKSLRKYLIYSITMHIIPFDRQALMMDFPFCRRACTHLSRPAPRSTVNKRKLFINESDATNFSHLKAFDFIKFSLQTLTTLDLSRNTIGATGAQHLAQALHNNTVRRLVF